MFEVAQPTMESALASLERNSPAAKERLRDAITLLNKWPLAHNVERNRGRTMENDFMVHYGVIGSEGKLELLPAPGLARGLRNTIGKRFETLVRHGKARSALGSALLRAGGWFYLAMPDQCRSYLCSQIGAAAANVLALSAVDLHAIGLGITAKEEFLRFYPLVVKALRHPEARPNNWLRAVRNICRFRNNALHPEAISDVVLMQLVEELFETMRTQLSGGNFAPRIFGNCLEAIPFLLKRRRYNADFLAPDSPVAKRLIRFLEEVDREYRWRLPTRLQQFPKATLNFLHMKATLTDLEQLLGVEDEDDDG